MCHNNENKCDKYLCIKSPHLKSQVIAMFYSYPSHFGERILGSQHWQVTLKRSNSNCALLSISINSNVSVVQVYWHKVKSLISSAIYVLSTYTLQTILSIWMRAMPSSTSLYSRVNQQSNLHHHTESKAQATNVNSIQFAAKS